jgi:hypothetical protein
MKFEITSACMLPTLAWAALIVPHRPTVRVLAGDGVIHRDNVFWEGLSLTPESPEAAPAQHFPLSTGGLAQADQVTFWTPGHFLDRLFLIQGSGGTFVSNSLPFALRVSGAELARGYLHYPWQFGHITAHSQTAPLERGRVWIISNANLVIGRDGNIRVSRKPAAPQFADYGEYIDLVHAFLDHVADANRQNAGGPYVPIATLSSGYDSPAAAVLAKRIGLTQAISICDSRAGSGDEDSGEAVARHLGLKIRVIRRTQYLTAGWAAERLFYVFGLPEDIYMYPFAADLKRTLLVTGVHGDIIWDRNVPSADGTWSWDPGGATLQEFRLRVGFVHLPPALYGWRHHGDLIKISRSSELAPWSLGTSYDRPIARRLVEEAGVPRELFGMKKRAVSVTIGIDKKSYFDSEALLVTAEMQRRLAEHACAASSTGVKVNLALASALHGATRILHRHWVDSRLAAIPVQNQNRWSGIARRMLIRADRAWPIRRRYMAPFSEINFSTQIANASLIEDYLSFGDGAAPRSLCHRAPWPSGSELSSAIRPDQTAILH